MAITADIQHMAYVERFSCHPVERLISRRGSIFDASQVALTDLRIGATVYPLRQELTGRYVRALEELSVDGVSPVFVGRGTSENEAIDDFSLNVHARFQELLYKRPFEMDDNEKQQWRIIHEMIDVTVYINRTPLQVRQMGTVQYRRYPYPTAIQWDNGYTEEVSLSQVDSPDFVTFKPGQPIEAVVVREPLSRKLIRIPFIARADSLRTPAEIERSGLADRLGSSADLPDADWD